MFYVTRGFIASTRAFYLVTRASNLVTRAFNLPIKMVSSYPGLLVHSSEL